MAQILRSDLFIFFLSSSYQRSILAPYPTVATTYLPYLPAINTYLKLAYLWLNTIIPRASFNVNASRAVAMRATNIPHQKQCPDNDERNKVLAILINSPF